MANITTEANTLVKTNKQKLAFYDSYFLQGTDVDLLMKSKHLVLLILNKIKICTYINYTHLCWQMINLPQKMTATPQPCYTFQKRVQTPSSRTTMKYLTFNLRNSLEHIYFYQYNEKKYQMKWKYCTRKFCLECNTFMCIFAVKLY